MHRGGHRNTHLEDAQIHPQGFIRGRGIHIECLAGCRWHGYRRDADVFQAGTGQSELFGGRGTIHPHRFAVGTRHRQGTERQLTDTHAGHGQPGAGQAQFIQANTGQVQVAQVELVDGFHLRHQTGDINGRNLQVDIAQVRHRDGAQIHRDIQAAHILAAIPAAQPAQINFPIEPETQLDKGTYLIEHGSGAIDRGLGVFHVQVANAGATQSDLVHAQVIERAVLHADLIDGDLAGNLGAEYAQTSEKIPGNRERIQQIICGQPFLE